MKLELWTNNAYDTVLLRDNADNIIGAWAGDHRAVQDYYHAVAVRETGSDWSPNWVDWNPIDGIDTLVAWIDQHGKQHIPDQQLYNSRAFFNRHGR